MKTDTDQYNFQKVDGTKIEDVISYINNEIMYAPNAQLYLGVDSKVKATKTYYAIVVGIYHPGKGAHIIHAKKFGPKLGGRNNMAERLRNEVNYAVDVGLYLGSKLSRSLTIHVDINPDSKHDSNIVHRYARGYLSGTGLDYEVKPNSFMAMRAADFLTYADRY